MDATINTASGIGRCEVSTPDGLSTAKAITAQPPTGSPVEDVVELSPAGIALSRGAVQSLRRFARISEIRAAIRAETFETPERVAETVKKLLKVIG